MVYLQTTYELCFGGAYFEYFESCNFSRENTNIDVFVFMFDLRMINMSSECEYDWYWKISACSSEYEVCDLFASLTRHQTSYSGSADWYFRHQSIHIQITYTSLTYNHLGFHIFFTERLQEKLIFIEQSIFTYLIIKIKIYKCNSELLQRSPKCRGSLNSTKNSTVNQPCLDL